MYFLRGTFSGQWQPSRSATSGGAGRFDGGERGIKRKERGRIGSSRKITRIMSNLSAPLHPLRLDAVEKRTIGN